LHCYFFNTIIVLFRTKYNSNRKIHPDDHSTIRLGLLLLFLIYYGSSTFFPHFHVVDGVTIVHSHPYKNNSNPSNPGHQHNNNGLVFIQLISSLQTCTPDTCCSVINPDLYVTGYTLTEYNSTFSDFHFINSESLKAPPSGLA
jgi:hypothetical protein